MMPPRKDDVGFWSESQRNNYIVTDGPQAIYPRSQTGNQERLDQPPETNGYPDPAVLREERRKKKLIIKGMSKFNESPRGGLAFLQDKGIIESATDPECVASFLKSTTLASKKVLGEFISKRGNEAILDHFMDSFDFTDKRVDEARR